MPMWRRIVILVENFLNRDKDKLYNYTVNSYLKGKRKLYGILKKYLIYFQTDTSLQCISTIKILYTTVQMFGVSKTFF